MKEERNAKKIVMTIALVVVTIFLGVSGVYAYFSAAVTQDETSQISKY